MDNISGFKPVKFDPFAGSSGPETFNMASATKDPETSLLDVLSIDVEKNKGKLQEMGMYDDIKRLQSPLV